MGRLGGGVDDAIRLDLRDQGQDTRPVADVELMVSEPRDLTREALLVPTGIPRRAEKDGPLVVVDAVDGEALGAEEEAHFGADQTGGTGDEKTFGGSAHGRVRARTGGHPALSMGQVEILSGFRGRSSFR